MTPLGDRILVERIDDTDGKERTLESGLVLPARDMTLKHGRAERIPDTFRARVIAASKQANDVGVRAGDEVIVHTYDQRPDKTLVGEETSHGLFVRIDDVLGVLETCSATNHAHDRREQVKQDEWNAWKRPSKVDSPLAVESLGFFPARRT